MLVTRLVVHIGAQRAASPGLHKSLYDNSDALLEHGVLVPLSGRHEMSSRAVRHQLLAWSFDPDGDHPYQATVWDELADEAAESPASTVLLSSELLAGVAGDPRTADAFRRRLLAIVDDVTIVFFARDQLALLNSLYCQRVRSLEVTCDFDTYIAGSPDATLYDLAASFESWYTAGDIRFVAMPWDPRSDGDALPALLALGGIEMAPGTLLPGEAVKDVDLGPVAIEANRLLGSYLRGRFPDFRPGEPAARRLRRKVGTSTESWEWDVEEFWGWSPQQAARAAARYAGPNEHFARHVWHDDWGLQPPVTRERRTAELVELDPTSVNRVHRYLVEMEGAFERLRRRESAA